MPVRLGVEAGQGHEAVEEVHRRRSADLEAQHGNHGDLHLQHLFSGVRLVCDIDVVLYRRGVRLLELRCDQHGCDAGELQESAGDLPLVEVAVGDGHRKVQGFRPQAVPAMDIHEPIDKDGSHLTIDGRLSIQVVGARCIDVLLATKQSVDVGHVLRDELRVVLLPRLVGIHGLGLVCDLGNALLTTARGRPAAGWRRRRGGMRAQWRRNRRRHGRVFEASRLGALGVAAADDAAVWARRHQRLAWHIRDVAQHVAVGRGRYGAGQRQHHGGILRVLLPRPHEAPAAREE
mmetsp:Transcript_19552/g.56936  ORF Transcript_19552/g.56936 Transcript_19552/m.56936 type:complete len:290 (-) Transcript_19552:279-1148(-)